MGSMASFMIRNIYCSSQVTRGVLPIKDLSVEWVMGEEVKKRQNNSFLE